MIWLEQSAAVTLKIGPFLDEDDGKTAETGLTIAQADVRLSKNGGDIAQKTEATSCTHDELGIYGCPIDATDTATLGRLQLWVHESGALPVWHEFMVVPANVWDSMFGVDYLQVDAVQVEGADPTDTIRDAVVDDATRIDASELNTLSGHDPGGTLCADATPLTAAETESEANDALVALHLDHLLAADYDPASKPGTATALLNELVESDAGVSRYTVNALEQARGTNSAALASVCTEARLAELAAANLPTDIADVPTVAEFNARTQPTADYFDPAADTVVDVTTVATLTGHTVQTGDSYARLGAPAGASIAADLVAIDNFVDDLETRLTAARAGYLDELAAANIPADIDTLLTRITAAVALASVCTEARLAELAAANLPTDIDAILADTNELQTDWADGGRLDLLLDGASAPSAATVADAVWDEASAGHTDAGKAGLQLWTDLDAVLTDTNELQGDDVPGLISALNDVAVTDITQRQIPDSVPADGTRPTVEQALYMIVQFLYERGIVDTTMTVKKVDGSTSLITLTLDDGTDPTSYTRAT